MSNKMRKVTLSSPLKMGKQEITEITLSKPSAGQLRGVKLLDVLQMDVEAYEKLLPRITQPMLTDVQVAQLECEDLMSIMGEVQGFFVKTEATLTA